MNRTWIVLVALGVLASAMVPAVTVAQPAAAPTSVDSQPPTQVAQTNERENASVSPGAMLAGSIGAQQAEIQGNVEHRAFGHQIAAAVTNQSRAQVLAHTRERLQERLDDLQERLRTLEQARANGSISEARYQAQVTTIAARTEQVRTQANASTRVAAGLPAEVLERHGVNVTALEQLRTRAQNLTGPEIAALARQIAGKQVGQPLGPRGGVPGGPPDGIPGGPPADGNERGNGSDAGQGKNGGGQNGGNPT